MTVVKVWGRMNNGYSVDFTYISGNTWEVSVPDDSPDGYYIAECWAEDEAGNIGYKIAKLWIIDGSMSCLEWLDDPWKINLIADSLAITLMDDDFSLRHIIDGTSLLYIPTTYSLHYVCPCEGVRQ